MENRQEAGSKADDNVRRPIAYDLSINRYKEVAYEAVGYDSPEVILQRLAKLEKEIEKGRKGLERMLETSTAGG